MSNRKFEKTNRIVFILNTLDFMIGLFCLITENLIAAACCFLLMSLNFIWIYYGNVKISVDSSNVVDQSVCSDDVTYGNSYHLLPDYDFDCENAQTLELVSFLNDFMAEYELALKTLAVHTTIHSPSEKIIVQMPHDLLRLALQNIMDNTLKYLMESCTISITLSILDTQALLIWKDNGNGVSDYEVSQLLNLNVQGSNRRSGNGLGLAQTRAAIETCGGTIFLKSSLGKGFAIYMNLPLAAPVERTII